MITWYRCIIPHSKMQDYFYNINSYFIKNSEVLESKSAHLALVPEISSLNSDVNW